jgi:uncharacterized membrane protein
VTKKHLWYLAKTLEALGMILVLVGLVMSIDLGMRDEGLASMAYEGKGLLLGGGLFVVGWLLERSVGAR